MSIGNVNTMVFNDVENMSSDLFGEKLAHWCERMAGQEDYGMFTIDEAILKSINESDVIIFYLRYLLLI
jgi:hypothetical protein